MKDKLIRFLGGFLTVLGAFTIAVSLYLIPAAIAGIVPWQAGVIGALAICVCTGVFMAWE